MTDSEITKRQAAELARQGKEFAEQAQAETKRLMAEMAASTEELKKSLGPPDLNSEFFKEIAESTAQYSAWQDASHQRLNPILRRKLRR